MAMLTSIMTGGVNNHPTTSDEANAWSTDFVSEGIVGSFSSGPPLTGAFATTAQGTPDMTVAVATGVCYVQGTPTSQSSQTFRVKHTASENVTIAANSSGSTKYDWVYIKLDATKLNGPNVAGDDAATLTTSRSTSQSSDDGTPPTYSYPIAVVTVANGATSITSGNIRDSRANCIVNLGSSSVSSGWTDLGYSPNTVTALGNRSYSLVFNSTDLTGTTSVGQRLKLPRTVTAPTGSISLNGTTQYANKTSPAGMTFTDDFVVSAWVKLTQYGATSAIASRYNGTSGWIFDIDSSGLVRLAGFNAGAANFSRIQSYQSLPLNKWVHVSAQLDMSTFTSTTTTSYVMFDGKDVPALSARGGTNPTSLINNVGNLEIGSYNGGTQPWPGQIAQVAIYSAKVPQATILASMNQTLTGSETSLISAYKLDQASGLNDLSANANNLTAQGSPTYSTTQTPFTNDVTGTSITAGTTNYGIIMKQTFSTNTTYTIQIPEGETLPTTGGIGTVSYSTQKTPYGFPSQRGKWTIESLNLTRQAASSLVSGTVYNIANYQISVPTGEWYVGYSVQLYNATSTSVQTDASAVLSTTQAAYTSTDRLASGGSYFSAVTESMPNFQKQANVSTATITPYYFNIRVNTTGTITGIQLFGDKASNVLWAENAYL